MAKVKMNPIFEQISGKFGELVFRNASSGIIIARPPSTEGREWTEAQLAHREKFRQAALYGKTVMIDPDTHAVYDTAANKSGKPVFSVIMADFLNAPSVDEVDLAGYSGQVGDVILIKAHDDFEVTAVAVEITDTNGNEIESGQATETLPGSGRWNYTAIQAVAVGTTARITVTATDRPGGTGEAEREKTL